MKKYQKQHSGLFLIELIVSILFFSLAAALCLQLFAKASLKSTQSTQLTHAVLIATSAAEAVENGCIDADALSEYFSEASVENGRMQVYYNDSWQMTSSDDGKYVLEVSFVDGLESPAEETTSDITDTDDSKETADSSKENADFSKGSTDFSKGNADFSEVNTDSNTENKVFSEEHTSFYEDNVPFSKKDSSSGNNMSETMVTAKINVLQGDSSIYELSVSCQKGRAS